VRVPVAETKKEKSNQVAKTQVHVADKFQQSTTLTAVPTNQDPLPAWMKQAKSHTSGKKEISKKIAAVATVTRNEEKSNQTVAVQVAENQRKKEKTIQSRQQEVEAMATWIYRHIAARPWARRKRTAARRDGRLGILEMAC
jgi:hypothetical protein